MISLENVQVFKNIHKQNSWDVRLVSGKVIAKNITRAEVWFLLDSTLIKKGE
jgi:hypothetical protein